MIRFMRVSLFITLISVGWLPAATGSRAAISGSNVHRVAFLTALIGNTGDAFVNDLRFSPDGRYLLAQYDHSPALHLWDVATLAHSTLPESYGPGVFALDGKRLVSAGRLFVLRLWNLDEQPTEVLALKGTDGGTARLFTGTSLMATYGAVN